MEKATTLPLREATPAADACCEPDCGPETCGPGAEAPIEVPRLEQSPGSCCEPDCGPATCR